MSALYFFSFCWLGLCRAAGPTKNIFGQNVTNWKDMTGQAIGEFQFLGELYFPDDKDQGNKSRVVSINILTKEAAPDTLKVLLFDNQPSSFGMIGRGNLGDSCNAKSMVSKSLTGCKKSHLECSHGLQINQFAYSRFGPDSDFCPNCYAYEQKIAVETKTYLTWYFVAAQCGGGAVQIFEYFMESKQAGLLPGATYGDKTAIKGTTANGNFELLGSLCFFTGPVLFGQDPNVTVTVTYDNQTPCCETVSLLAYDDKGLDALFDSRFSSYTFSDKEQARREALALESLPLRAGSNSHTWTIPFSALGSRGLEHAAIRLNFAVAHRSESNPPKVTGIKIHSPTAVNCNAKCPASEDCGPVVVHGRNLRRA